MNTTEIKAASPIIYWIEELGALSRHLDKSDGGCGGWLPQVVRVIHAGILSAVCDELAATGRYGLERDLRAAFAEPPPSADVEGGAP